MSWENLQSCMHSVEKAQVVLSRKENMYKHSDRLYKCNLYEGKAKCKHTLAFLCGSQARHSATSSQAHIIIPTQTNGH